jgi:hypothetical protein
MMVGHMAVSVVVAFVLSAAIVTSAMWLFDQEIQPRWAEIVTRGVYVGSVIALTVAMTWILGKVAALVSLVNEARRDAR